MEQTKNKRLNYFRNRTFSDITLDQTIELMNTHFGEEWRIASDYQDTHFCADIVSKSGKTCAVRCRDHKHIKYAHEFTIRYSLPSGIRTEWEKIVVDGHGDYLFYCFLSPPALCRTIIRYWIGDLDVFRKCAQNGLSKKVFWNKDKSRFAIIRLQDLPPNFILFSSN